MLLPALLPKEYAHYAEAANSAALFARLTAKPTDLFIFFEEACEDETWSEQNLDFMRSCLQWLTDQFCSGNISIAVAKQIARAVFSHFPILSACIPHDIELVAEKKRFPMNRLLAAASSNFFYDLIRGQQANPVQIEVKKISSSTMLIISEFLEKGNVEWLWKLTQNEMMLTLKQATRFGLAGLMELCEISLKRYIDETNVIEMLKMSHAEGWRHLRQICFNLINHDQRGIVLESHHEQDLIVEFSEFNESSLNIFDAVKPLITHLIFSSTLTANPTFRRVILRCPKLISLDIGRTRDFSEYLYDIPASLQELDLSLCNWLTDAHFKRMLEICPELRRLSIKNSTGITYLGWGELQKLPKLIALDLSYCNQITDEDLKIIFSSCPNLSELGLEECKKLTEKALFELAQKQPGLIALNLARSNITDASLIEISSHCKNLVSLDLSRCKALTDRGVIQAVKYLFSLERLKITRTNLSQNAQNEIKKMRPKITLTT